MSVAEKKLYVSDLDWQPIRPVITRASKASDLKRMAAGGVFVGATLLANGCEQAPTQSPASQISTVELTFANGATVTLSTRAPQLASQSDSLQVGSHRDAPGLVTKLHPDPGKGGVRQQKLAEAIVPLSQNDDGSKKAVESVAEALLRAGNPQDARLLLESGVSSSYMLEDILKAKAVHLHQTDKDPREWWNVKQGSVVVRRPSTIDPESVRDRANLPASDITIEDGIAVAHGNLYVQVGPRAYSGRSYPVEDVGDSSGVVFESDDEQDIAEATSATKPQTNISQVKPAIPVITASEPKPLTVSQIQDSGENLASPIPSTTKPSSPPSLGNLIIIPTSSITRPAIIDTSKQPSVKQPQSTPHIVPTEPVRPIPVVSQVKPADQADQVVDPATEQEAKPNKAQQPSINSARAALEAARQNAIKSQPTDTQDAPEVQEVQEVQDVPEIQEVPVSAEMDDSVEANQEAAGAMSLEEFARQEDVQRQRIGERYMPKLPKQRRVQLVYKLQQNIVRPLVGDNDAYQKILRDTQEWAEVIWSESGWKEDAENGGHHGLMQV